MKMMFTCREMVDLISQELDQKVSLFSKLKMAMHLAMCRDCKTYSDQIRSVETLMNNHFTGEASNGAIKLSEEARMRIEERLHKD